MSIRSHERLVIENDLHRALDQQEFQLFYQPRVDPRTGTIQCSEALLRWKHPKLGMIPPDKFIPIAEESGLIVPLGAWVLHEACRQNKAWQDAGYAPMRVAVNVSAKQFGRGLTDSVAQALKESGLAPDWLEIEITESVLTDNENTVIASLRKLKSMGVHLAIDDFGTGYSNLAFLMKFEVDTLKIDRSFIQNIHRNIEHQLITTSVISLAHNLGMRVVTEGVETIEEHQFLLKYEPNEAQGYYYARPASALAYEKDNLNKQAHIG
ncbi:EAL domain-containing protein [Paenibacillus hexagrammi]|uniref:EAL domain-containing protein n=2 Tax=Paenibacillus hexagrammi TaxID=2908839 RepID=A0ABY3SQ86_9BACL|nr:EAL domain-containing protein [Paenibacillus sp. YPD9-1]